MRRAKLTYKALGEMVGIRGINAARHLRSDTVPPHHHAVWAKVLPVDVLPKPVHLKPGPKPKTEHQAA